MLLLVFDQVMQLALGSARHSARCQVASTFVKASLLSTGFLRNMTKSIRQPIPCLVYGCIDMLSRNISIPPESILLLNMLSTLSLLNAHFLLLGNWPV